MQNNKALLASQPNLWGIKCNKISLAFQPAFQAASNKAVYKQLEDDERAKCNTKTQ